jgi:hypothetical protein
VPLSSQRGSTALSQSFYYSNYFASSQRLADTQPPYTEAYPMTTPPRHTRHIRAGSAQQSRADHTPQTKAGRPQGAPSTIGNLRIPVDLLAQLDRYIDRRESQPGLKAHRGLVTRRA